MDSLFRGHADRLQRVESYEVEGTVEVMHSEAVMSNSEEDRVQRYRFRVWGAGTSLKARYDRLVHGRSDGRSEIFYNDPEKVVSLDLPGGIATMSRKDATERRLGLRNRSPAFMEYSFLQAAMDISGIIAAVPSELRDGEGGSSFQTISKRSVWNQDGA